MSGNPPSMGKNLQLRSLGKPGSKENGNKNNNKELKVKLCGGSKCNEIPAPQRKQCWRYGTTYGSILKPER